jgi:sulfur carrier protein
MTARLVFRDKEFEVRSGATIRDAVKQCGLSPEAVLPTRDGELITDDEILRDGDVIRLVAVISGGADTRVVC